MISQFIVALALAVSPVEAPKATPAPVTVSAPAVANKAEAKPAAKPALKAECMTDGKKVACPAPKAPAVK